MENCMSLRRCVKRGLWKTRGSLPTVPGGGLHGASRFWICHADNHRVYADRSDAPLFISSSKPDVRSVDSTNLYDTLRAKSISI